MRTEPRDVRKAPFLSVHLLILSELEGNGLAGQFVVNGLERTGLAQVACIACTSAQRMSRACIPLRWPPWGRGKP